MFLAVSYLVIVIQHCSLCHIIWANNKLDQIVHPNQLCFGSVASDFCVKEGDVAKLGRHHLSKAPRRGQSTDK